MIKNISKYILAAWLCVFGLMGCKKGDDGTPGKDGNANVTCRTFTASSWTLSSSIWYTQLSVPEITASNTNTAAVMTYWGIGTNTWVAIPYTHVASTNYFMGFVATTGIVEINWQYNSSFSNGSNPNTVLNNGNPIQVKVVVIPPALKRMDVDLKDYSAVAKAYHLN